MTRAVKLTAYLGERDTVGGRFLADELTDLLAGLRTAVLLRGAEGFGTNHRLQSDRLLSLSEDLPLIAIGIDRPDRVEAAAERALRTMGRGFLTLERAAAPDPDGSLGLPDGETVKVTLIVGRRERVGGRIAWRAAVESLARGGALGATALLGVDGARDGKRRRARLVGRNANVPVMVIGLLPRSGAAAAIQDLRRDHPGAMVLVERATVVWAGGRQVADLPPLPAGDPSGMPPWQKIVVHARGDRPGPPVHERLVRSLREAGATGATTLRALYGFQGGGPPRGERMLSVRRAAPTLTVAVDRPDRVASWIDAATEAAGDDALITSEVVPAARARPLDAPSAPGLAGS